MDIDTVQLAKGTRQGHNHDCMLFTEWQFEKFTVVKLISLLVFAYALFIKATLLRGPNYLVFFQSLPVQIVALFSFSRSVCISSRPSVQVSAYGLLGWSIYTHTGVVTLVVFLKRMW